MRKVYIKVSNDKYELPEAIADSPTELAHILGMKPKSVMCSISKGYPQYKKVEFVDFEEDWDDEQT